MELFEQLRREYEFGTGTVKGVARKFGVHRRMVRQAVENAMPPVRGDLPHLFGPGTALVIHDTAVLASARM